MAPSDLLLTSMIFSLLFTSISSIHLKASSSLRSPSLPHTGEEFTNTILTLLERGYHPNDMDFIDELSPLCLAANALDLPLTSLLISHGAAIDDDRCRNGWTPLMFASAASVASSAALPIIQLLLSHGANPYHISHDASSPYHSASDPKIRALLENVIRSSPDHRRFLTSTGQLSLILPIAATQPRDTLRALLSSPESTMVAWSNVDERSAFLQTPLMLAAQSGLPQNMRLLLDNSAEVNLQDANGWTALLHAIHSNCLVCIELLLNSNALASLQSPSGDSLLTLSSSPLLAANILHVSLCKAITRRDPEEILALVSLGADPNTQCEHNFNYTPLIIAAKLSHLELTRSLLKDFHANPNLTDSHQWSPLMFATIQKSASSAPASQSSTSFQILQLLVEHGSDLEQRNRDGMTAVQLAAFIQHEAFYRFLSAQR